MSPYGLETYPTRVFFDFFQISECIFCRSTDFKGTSFDDFQRPLLKAYETGNVLCHDCQGADRLLLQKNDLNSKYHENSAYTARRRVVN